MNCKRCDGSGWIVTDEINGLRFKKPCKCLDLSKPLWEPLEDEE